MRKVPKLRFKEFTDEWEEKKLGEITKITAGGTPSTTKTEYWNGNIKWMNSGELNLKYVYEVQGRITEEGLKNSSTKLIPKNCILIGLAGQGKTRGTVAINFIELCTNQSIASILPNYQAFIPLFLYFNLDNRYVELRGLSTGSGGRGGLNLGILNSLTSNFPALQEQEKIAKFLSSVDKKISLTEEKLELFKEYKKGVMQKIFSQELRFKDNEGNDYPEWKEGKIKDFGYFYYGKSAPKHSVVELGGTPCIRYGELYSTYNEYIKEIKSYTNIPINELKLSKGGEVLVPRVGEDPLDFANCSYLPLENIAIGEMISVYNTEENGLFITYYFNATMKKEFAKYVEGASVSNLYFTYLENIKIIIPSSLEEQQKIADFLSSIDSKIEKIEKELENLKEFKKGLLQQMFV